VAAPSISQEKMLSTVGDAAGYSKTAAEQAIMRVISNLVMQSRDLFEFRKQRRTMLRFLIALVAVSIIFTFSIRV
jgi:hypothetical protein